MLGHTLDKMKPLRALWHMLGLPGGDENCRSNGGLSVRESKHILGRCRIELFEGLV